mmetsp:Transcript_14670/g.33217  ORF Transcript_14670/g.33217 Transcript_14670/m.33217 type:complete len:232 (-) Transcript_14670:138-833(-)
MFFFLLHHAARQFQFDIRRGAQFHFSVQGHDGIAVIQGVLSFLHLFPQEFDIRSTLLTRATVGRIEFRRPMQHQVTVVRVPDHGGMDQTVGVGADHLGPFVGGHLGLLGCGNDQIFQNHIVPQVLGQGIGIISQDHVVTVIVGQTPGLVRFLGSFGTLAGPCNEFDIVLFHDGLVEIAQFFEVIMIVIAPGTTKNDDTAQVGPMNGFIQPFFGIGQVVCICLLCHDDVLVL